MWSAVQGPNDALELVLKTPAKPTLDTRVAATSGNGALTA